MATFMRIGLLILGSITVGVIGAYIAQDTPARAKLSALHVEKAKQTDHIIALERAIATTDKEHMDKMTQYALFGPEADLQSPMIRAQLLRAQLTGDGSAVDTLIGASTNKVIVCMSLVARFQSNAETLMKKADGLHRQYLGRGSEELKKLLE